jgi:hypothetical protein
MTLDEIKAAVEAGQTVHWASTSYFVIRDRIGQWLVKNSFNDYVWGLTGTDGTLSDKPEKFFLGGTPCPTCHRPRGRLMADCIGPHQERY